MKIEVDMEALLCLLKDEAEYTRNRRKENLPLPVEDIDHDIQQTYINGWSNGYREGVVQLIEYLRTLVRNDEY